MNSKNDNILPIRIRVRFQDSDSPKQGTEKEMTLCKDSDFLIRCPMQKCVGGGFDLRGINMGKQGLSETFVCSGWQDRDRINKHRCLYELHLQVIS